MASLLAQADAVRSAVASISTCTPTTSATLKELLLGKDSDSNPSKPPPKSRPGKATQASARAKPTPATSKRAPKTKTTSTATAQGDCSEGGSLAARDKVLLATQVINATLRALGDAAKAPPVPKPVPRSPSKNGMVKSATRKAIRRSNSMPMTPLQPRSLNRVSTSPATTRTCRSPSSLSASTGCLATVECARAAFSTLRSLQASGAATLPELQLESGMSLFINKLIGLSMFEQAVKELRILKRRLESMVSGNGSKKTTFTAQDSSTTPKTLSDLLDFPPVTASGPLLGFIISTQLQALRILHGLKKSAHLSAALPFLRQSCPSSPLNLISLSLQDEKPDRTKCARQLETLSQSLLSLPPSIAQKDDGIAIEPRLSSTPETSLEVQALGLATRLQSWNVSGHRGDVDKDILLPLSKCLAAFSRRSSSRQDSALASAFTMVWERIEKLGLKSSGSSTSPLAAIYQVLATASHESGNLNEAKRWMIKLRALTDSKADSAAKCCAVTAQLVALALKQSAQADEALIMEVLDGMQGSLSGKTTELDDLLVNICLLRKAAMSTVTQKSDSPTSASRSVRQLLETFIFQLPRFAKRWLGQPPASARATKDYIRFEQRRQLLSNYLHHLLESTLMLAKILLDCDRLAWDLMDSLFQDSLALLENMGDFAQSAIKNNPSASYHVKISHLYYQQHLTLRKSATKTTEHASLRSLRRSIDSVKHRPEAEQARAQLLVKWERFADLCRASGRRDDAADAFRSIRDHLVRQEIVSVITASLATQPVSVSWQQTPESQLLSRTVCNLSKLDREPSDWTWLLLGSDKATALEHDLYFILANDGKQRREQRLSDPIVKTLLKFYCVEEYPIRRLRTLLQLFTANLDARDELASLRAETDTALESIERANLGQDSGLARYVPHLRALAACIYGLVDADLDSPRIRIALSEWKLIVTACKTAEQLSDRIDSPVQLLSNLQSLADFARVKGSESLLTNILEVSSRVSQLTVESSVEARIAQSTALCLQFLSLGRSIKAEETLQSNEQLISFPEVSGEAVVSFHLSAAEYHLAVGSFDKVEHHLTEAHTAAVAPSSEQPLKKTSSFNKKISIAHASFLNSMLALERGDSPHALQFAKTAVKILFLDWTHLEELRSSSTDVSMAELSQAEASEADTSISSSRSDRSEFVRANTGPEFWALVYPLYRFVSRLSSTYAHLGMYQETLYYAEQAHKIAKSMSSSGYISQSTAWLASVWLMAGKTEKAVDLAAEAKPVLLASEPTYHNVKTICQLSSVYRETNDQEAETELVEKAGFMVDAMRKDGIPVDSTTKADLEDGMAKLSIKETASVKVGVRATRAVKTTRVLKKAAVKKTVARRAKSPAEVQQTQVEAEDIQISFLRASILQCRSTALLNVKDWPATIIALRAAFKLSKLSADMSQEHLLMGIGLIGQSLEQMGCDSVFSCVQDSTLSFPSVAGSLKSKTASDRSSITRMTPPRKGRSTPQDTQSFVENLREAHEHLLEAHTIASLNGNHNLIHRIATVLQNVVILLSTTNTTKSATSHPAHATCSIELARNLTWCREKKTLRYDTARDLRASWPLLVNRPDNRRCSLGVSIDMNRFQKDFVDIIPKSWNVVSVSLSDSKHDLCITKLQADHSPFAIRLPLERANSRDADTDVFSFQDGHSELLDIIKLANRTCHDARDMSSKEAKSAWWAEREQLDERMKDLLDNVEQTWLGGFKGIFTQHHRRTDLLARFQKSFQNILDKHLPSRRQVRGRRTKTAPPKVNLDPRILDLFIGLGDATAPQCDLDEPLMDLLYFVVDILQFHGERNAYDEIEFDAMVVETFDALHSYHSAAKNSKDGPEDVHTILILDRSLHIFPWESLPCLQGAAVSRVPSLACLRRSILEQQSPHSRSLDTDDEDELNAPEGRAGHYASIDSGTYILNPSADLKNTQATFGKALSSLPPAWDSIETRAPTEPEFEKALTGSDLLLYFGHGSGAQYIRGRTIRKMDKCRAVALLMGCSSASLANPGSGHFEVHGPVWNYMLAGSPAVVGTLWDVTDRDIDRFAGRVFEEWGLMAKGTFAEGGSGSGKGKGKAVAKAASGRGGRKKAVLVEEEDDGEARQPSLVEAVASARDACHFRYLTAAAVCVYGIPVYIKK